MRLYGPARQAFGARSCVRAAASVGALIELLAAEGGAGFADLLARSQVWVNGAPADAGPAIGETDEVAVLPPVSGG